MFASLAWLAPAPLFAQGSPALVSPALGSSAEGAALDAPARVFFALERVAALTEWWQWLLLLLVCLAVCALIGLMYWLDSVELPLGVTTLLVLLRVFAFAGLLVFFLDLQKRAEPKVVKNSRVALLIDTSQSMNLRDAGANDAASETAPTRAERMAGELSGGELINQLRQTHDVAVFRFDEEAKPTEIAAFAKRAAPEAKRLTTARDDLRWPARESRYIALGGLVLLGLSIGCGVLFLVMRGVGVGADLNAFPQLLCVLLLVFSAITFAVADLRNPEVTWGMILGLQDPQAPAKKPAEAGESGEPGKASQPGEPGAETPGAETPGAETPGAEAEPRVDWKTALAAEGKETRLGDCLRYLVNRERGGPLSGVVLYTDGGHNAGVEPSAAIVAARDAKFPVHVVGLGSSRMPLSVRVADLEAPERVYPGDNFTITGYVQAFGLEGRALQAELLAAPASEPDAETFVESKRVDLGADGEATAVKFEVKPEEEGRRIYKLRVAAPREDRDKRDNQKTATVQVIDRQNHVLLIAGGPAREFQFLRNMLYRDRDTKVDVWLQTSTDTASQEANKVLDDFPDNPDDLFKYDAIVAFDPDWLALSDNQLELLEKWVSDKAGGLVVVAGPVHTPHWSTRRRGDPKTDVVKSLYPVVFYDRGSALTNLGRFGGEAPWKLDFTRDGREAEFLWLEDEALRSEAAWNDFTGVFGYYTVREPKPGAKVYTRFSDPDTALDSSLPIYMASQFYGAGRVFFQASGEMWRLRAVDDAHFERYYTKLLRWVSQGRLLRDSSRGVLLVDKERCFKGDQVAVRAVLTNAQHQPLTADEVAALLARPDGESQPLVLRQVKDSARPGAFAAQFTAALEGDYRIELQVPQSEDDVLRREVRVSIPDLEIARPTRHDALLQEIAQKTGGEYYLGVDASMNRQGGGTPVASLLESKEQVTYLPSLPDLDFQKRLRTWLLGLICGVLCLEWLTRRLSKLA